MNSTSLFGRVLWCSLALGVPLAALGDIAPLQPTGPDSGGIFANIGPAAAYASAEMVAMKTAAVSIHLKRGEGDTLLAECEATFVMEDGRPPGSPTQEFLVAFPVTGLRLSAVAVNRFKVLVDGAQPPTVFRQAIEISRRKWKQGDRPIHGQLGARFAPNEKEGSWQVPFIDVGGVMSYKAAYAWPMATSTMKPTTVSVTYSVTLKPQRVGPKTFYAREDGGEDMIPFEDMPVSAWSGSYYFFDYVLASGSAWHGPIGSEVIKLTWDADLALNPRKISAGDRAAAGWNFSPSKVVGGSFVGPRPEERKDGLYWTISGKPLRDLLIAIPQSAIAPKAK